MSCTHPLNRINFATYGWKVCGENLTKEELWAMTNQYGAIIEQQKIACGQCFECRMNYSREWATRIEVEMKEWEHNWFLTLTYDDEHLPQHNYVDAATGEIINNSYLEPKDVAKFMNALRKRWSRDYGEDNIRFYASGEYGDEHQRAHYHIMLMNFNVRDMEFLKTNKKGTKLYRSPTVDHIWGKGFATFAEASWETAAYTAQYMLKKQKGPNAAAYYEAHHQTPEFTRMSRMPGIGLEWYQQNKDKLWATDEIQLAKGRKMHTPKYYDKLFDAEIEELDKRRSEPDATNEEARYQEMITLRNQIHETRRQKAEAAIAQKMAGTTLSYREILQIEHHKNMERQKKKLKRTVDI